MHVHVLAYGQIEPLCGKGQRGDVRPRKPLDSQTLSAPQALPTQIDREDTESVPAGERLGEMARSAAGFERAAEAAADRKSTRLNSSHSQISYAVFCLKKKKELQVRRPAGGDAGYGRTRALSAAHVVVYVA